MCGKITKITTWNKYQKQYTILFSVLQSQYKNLKWLRLKFHWLGLCTVLCCYECDELYLKQFFTWEGRSLQSSGFDSGKLLNDKVLYLGLDKGRLQPPADSTEPMWMKDILCCHHRFSKGACQQSSFCWLSAAKKRKEKKEKIDSYGHLTVLWAYCATDRCAEIGFIGCMRSI